MSPKAKSSLLNISAFIGAVVAVAGLSGSVKRVADSHFVRADTFHEYRIQQAGKASLDSLKHDREIEEIRRDMASVDTGVKCLRHALPRTVCEK